MRTKMSFHRSIAVFLAVLIAVSGFWCTKSPAFAEEYSTWNIVTDGTVISKYMGDEPFYLQDPTAEPTGFSSLNSGVASVDSNGLVTIRSIGTTKLYIYYDDESQPEYITVPLTVKQAPTKVDPEITYEIPKDLNLLSDGFFLNAKTVNCDAELTYINVVPDYLQVDERGWVTIIKRDQEFIAPVGISVPETATTKAKIFSIQVHVSWVPQTIQCKDTYATTMGKPVRIQATAVGKITFKSKDPKAATVSSDGKVTFLHPGEVIITVRAAETGIYWYCEKNVKVTCKMTAPTLKVTTPKKRCAKLTWSKVGGAQQYLIYVKYPGKKKYKAVLSKSAKIKSVTHKGLKKGKKYSYKVRAYLVSDGGVYYGPFSKAKTVKIR